MRGTSYSQKSLTVCGSSKMRVQSPSPSRYRSSSYSRGRAGFQGTAVEVGTEIHQLHANEKEEMQDLNVRFAGYIEKVQALEQRNATLRAELDNLRGRYKGGPTGIADEYELKFKAMRDLIESLTKEKGAADIERGYIEEEVEMWRLKLEEELALKAEAEMILREFREDVDNATLQKADLEKRVEQLVAEIEFLKKLHDEEVADLAKQIEESKVTVELDVDRPDLAAYLRSMRAEIEQVASRNVNITQEVVSTVVSDVPSAEVTVPSVEITSTEPAPAETAPEPEQEATAAEEPVTAEEEPATTEPESAPEPNTETIQSESADLPAETIPGLQAEIEAAATGTVSDLISTSASVAEEAAGTKADDKGAPSEEATVENGDCEIADSSAGPPAPLELNSESQEQVLQPAVEQLAEECLNGIGLPAEPPKEKTDCELKKDWELPEAIGELGEAVSAPVNQVVDLV